jgi:hypothetical protein
MKTHLFSSLTLALSLPLLAQSPLGPYQIVLEKSLLGRADAPPSPAATPPPATVATPGWASEYRMTMLTKDDYNGSVRIGLQNVRDNSGLLLMEDDPPGNPFRLLRADFERNQATVTYQGSSHVFSLESGAPPPPAEPAPQSGGRGQQPTRRRVIEPPAPPVPTPPAPEEAAPRFRTQEELDTHLKEVQMDAIRTGKPPLPIPLTPEMDAQLVREGVLPPPGSP